MNQDYVDDLVRTFVALKVPENLVDAFRRIQGRARIDLPRGLRWTRPDQAHMTLAFLGEVAQEQLPELSAIVEDVAGEFAPFEVQVRTIGGFPRAQRPRVVWAGVEGDSVAAFSAMHEMLWARFAPIKPKPKPDARPFHPHLTLARVPGPQPPKLADWMEKHADWDFGRWRVSEMALIRSVLTPTGPNYETISAAALGHSGSRASAV